jgi:hypothetical protein
VDGTAGADIALFVCLPKEGAVVGARGGRDGAIVAVRIPGVDVRVKVDDRDGTVDFMYGFEDGEDL